MRTTALRLYGKNDIRLESYELPPITEDELLVKVVTDSLCMSTYKAVSLGTDHKRVPKNAGQTPVIIGHEMCAEVVEVGANLRGEWLAGERAVIQPALNMPDNSYSVGYSFQNFGGNMTYGIIPKVVIERGCVIKTSEKTFFKGSLAEPLSGILRAFKSMDHMDKRTFKRFAGVKEGGILAIFGGAGPMGIGAIDIALNYAKPSQIVVTDMNDERLARAAKAFSPKKAAEKGIKLVYQNMAGIEDQKEKLLSIAPGGFDDIFIMVSSPAVVELADSVLAFGGCSNFFAGPTEIEFSARINFYRMHYDYIHHIGTSGGSPDDMVETVRLTESGALNPAAMISHVGGLDSTASALLSMGKPQYGLKKLCYNGIRMPMTALDELPKLGTSSAFFNGLAEIVEESGGLWCAEAEEYLLAKGEKIR